MLRLTSVSASEVVIGEVADKFKLPCQRVHAVTVSLQSAGFEPMLAGFESNRLRPLGHHASSTQHKLNRSLLLFIFRRGGISSFVNENKRSFKTLAWKRIIAVGKVRKVFNFYSEIKSGREIPRPPLLRPSRY